jgi:uncharacterized membrane protein YdjX (TVP38/TMEM64 family)
MPPRRSLLIRAAHSPTLYALAGLLILGVILYRWVASLGGLEAFRESYGAVAPLVTVPIHIVIAITPIPADFISIANGAIYGFAMGTALSWLGWWIGGLAEFGLGWRARKDFELDRSMDRMPGWLRRFPIDHPVFLIGARQIPWLGGHLTSFVPGAAGVSLRRYLWCSAIAIVPGSVVMAAIGAGLMKL